MLRGIGYVVARRDGPDQPPGRPLPDETVACLLIVDAFKKVMRHLARGLVFRAHGTVEPSEGKRDA